MQKPEIAPGIIVEQRYPPFNVGLIRLDEGCIVVNAPPLPDDSYDWRRTAQALGGRIRYLVITNADALHLVGALLWQVPLILSPQAAERVRSLDERSWDLFRQGAEEALAAFDIEALSLLSLPPAPPLQVHGSPLSLHLRYEGEPRRLTAFAVPSMPRGELWLRVEELSLLFAGDGVVVDDVPVIERRDDMDAWTRQLVALEREPLRWIVPGRGAARIAPANLEEMRELLRVMERSALDLASRPPGEGIGQAVRALRQSFFPHAGKDSPIARQLRASLTRRAAALRGDPEDTEEVEG